MALVTFPLNELAGQDPALAERVEDEIRGTLACYEPPDMVVECRITVHAGGAEPPAPRIGVKLSSPGAAGQPGWARAFGLALDGAGPWLRGVSLERVFGLMEVAPR